MNVITENPLLTVLLQTLVDTAIVINDRGIMIAANDPCVQIFGHEKSELIGVNISLLMPNPDRDKHDLYIKNYQRTGKAQIIGIGREVEGLRKDGTVFPMYLAIGEMELSGQRCYLGIIRDLSERKARQKAFDELQARHFHLSRVSAMNEMGTAIAHEINQPLTAGANYLETARILLSRVNNANTGAATEKIDDMMTKSVDQIKQASKIISRMRRFIERGDIQAKTFPINSILEDAIILGLSQHVNKDIQVTVEISDDTKQVHADPVQTQQVLVNLIRNAAEAMEHSPRKHLSISVSPDLDQTGFARIEISDTGHGIDPEQHEKLFSAFASTKETGLGVGLSISRSIVSAMGGRVWTLENPGGGAIFTFTLPLSGPTLATH